MNALSRAGVVVLQSKLNRPWLDETTAILEVLRSHNPEQADYREVAPPVSEQAQRAVRDDLTEHCAGLAELAGVVRERLLGSCAVFIPELGLSAFDTQTRALLSYAIATCLGSPTATDKRQVIWDVKARKVGAPGFITFSETDLEATFHSDSAFSAAPEPIFLLYCMEAARCGVGCRACDARALRGDIEQSAPWIANVLSNHPLPFRVPSAFLKSGDRAAIEATLAPVFADSPLIRYRRDTLLEGLQNFPEYDHPDARRALDAFDALLNESPHTVNFSMPRDSLVVMDNHRTLHARSAFQDHNRHLLRIRLAWENAPAHTYGYPTVTRPHHATAA